MELHYEVIRDKETIYTELLQSKSMGYQLAICYKNDENLIVKICNVMDIVQDAQSVAVTVRTEPAESSQLAIALDQIESIYPIHGFQK